MTKKIDTSDLLPILLIKMPDGSVSGSLPSGQVVTWPADYSSKPTLRHKRVVLNCNYYRPVWTLVFATTAELAVLRLRAAQVAFESFEFDSDEVTDSDGWDTTDPRDYTKLVYGETCRYNLHVRFDGESPVASSVEAFDMKTGNIIGSMPPAHKEAPGMPLIFSYCIEDTDRLHTEGFTLLGAGFDASGKEALVFQKRKTGDYQVIQATDVAGLVGELAQAEADPTTRCVLEQAHRQLLCLLLVHSLLDGTEYDSGTASDAARWLIDAGFVVRDIDDMEEEEQEEEEEEEE